MFKNKHTTIDRRRSQRRRTNVQPPMRSSALPTTIFHENNHINAEIHSDSNPCPSDQTNSSIPANELVFTTTSINPKSSFWTVTDRQSDWYKLRIPKDPTLNNQIDEKLSFKLLTEIARRRKHEEISADELKNTE